MKISYDLSLPVNDNAPELRCSGTIEINVEELVCLTNIYRDDLPDIIRNNSEVLMNLAEEYIPRIQNLKKILS